MGALMFLTEKKDKSVKGKMVYNGKPTREWPTREDSASPTAALESIMLTASDRRTRRSRHYVRRHTECIHSSRDAGYK